MQKDSQQYQCYVDILKDMYWIAYGKYWKQTIYPMR